MSAVAIRAQGLGKRYRIGEVQRYRALRDVLTDAASAPFRRLARLVHPQPAAATPPSDNTIWALRDVSFEVPRGDVVGIIGRNGAGKTTLLRILARITEPTEGQAEVHGRVGSLLDVATGFHPELTGRENIYLNGAILGMKKREIAGKFDEIVAFAETGKFVDTPVKQYSSGMYLRLAFAVAAHLEPEVLLVDEVLAVGDADFQRKCLGKMGEVAQQGRTVLFVSHNMAAIQNLCHRCVLIENGRVLTEGDTEEVISTYLASNDRREVKDLRSRKDRNGDGSIQFQLVSFHRKNGESASTFLSGDDLIVKLRYTVTRPLSPSSSILVGLSVQDAYGDTLFLCSNELTGEIEREWPTNGDVICRITRLPLSRGVYSTNIYLAVNGVVADWVTEAAVFEMEIGDFYGTGRNPPSSHSRFLVPHAWSIE